MAITTDSYFDIVHDEETLDRIGLSKTLDNYSISEIADYSYVGSYSYYGKQMMSKSLSGYTYVGFSQLNGSCPFAANFHSGTYETIDIEDGQTENYNLTENGLYRRVILLNAVNGQYDDVINNISNYKIITEFDAPKYTIDMGNKSSMLFESTPYWYYDSVGGTTRYNTHLGANDNVQIATCGFVAYVIIPFNSTYYILRASLFSRIFEAYSINNSYQAHCSDVFTDYTGNNPAAIAETVVQWFKNYDFTNDDSTPIVHPLNTSIDYWSPYDGYCSLLRFEGAAMGFYQYFMFTDETKLMTFLAGMYGLHFIVDGTVYKPIITDNFVLGYSDDLTVTSDLDNYIGSTKHELPVTPPAPTPPPPSGDDPSDDQTWGGAYSGAGVFSKFYLCTATDLANLRTWFGGGGGGDQIPDGFDPMGQVLGLLQYPVSISGTALSPDEITFRSGKTVIHTGVNADRSTGGFLHLDCGSVEIPRRMQQRGVPFLDFETTLEIYVPFCGTAPLDVQTCVGKTLTCDMYVATATGDVSAVIAAGGHPVAYMSGNMAESLPISSSGYGMYLAACKSTWGNGVSQVMNQLTGGTVDTMKNVNQAALNETLSYGQTGGWGHSELIRESYNNPHVGSAMAAAASPIGAAAIGLIKTGLNVANAASTSYEQYQRVKHASYTSVSGSFTSCAAWNYPFTPYVKITRPHQQIPTGGRGDYKHTAAIPLVETKTLSGAPGLTTCVNPDVSGIANATAQEKDIIYRALVNGVIV